MKLALKKNLKQLLQSRPLPYWEIAELMAENNLYVPEVVEKTDTLKSTAYYIWNTYWKFKTTHGNKNNNLKWLEKQGYSWSAIKRLGQCQCKDSDDQLEKVMSVLKEKTSPVTVKKIKELIKAASTGNIDRELKKNHKAARLLLENEYIAMTNTPFQKMSDKQLRDMRHCINKYFDTL